MFEPIQKFIKLSAHKNNLARQLEASQICENARKTLKENFENLAEQSRIRSFKEGTLYIDVESAVVSQEFFYIRDKFLDLTNQKLGSALISNLRLTLKKNSLD